MPYSRCYLNFEVQFQNKFSFTFSEYLQLNTQFKSMIKKIFVLMLTVTFALSESAEYSSASFVIKAEKQVSGLKNKVFHLQAGSYSSILSSNKKQVIKIVKADPMDGCNFLTKIDQQKQPYPVYYLVMGRDGSCTYTKKAYNSRIGLANGVIIIDSPKGINNLNMFLNKDYFQVFLMPEDEGDSLISHSEGSFLIELTINRVDHNVARAEIWISSLNRKSYQLLKWWKNSLQAVPILQQKVKWAPRFAFISCKNGSNSCGGEFSSCACAGDFCSPEKHGQTSNVLVREDIRQRIIFKEHSAIFLQYMLQFQERCLDSYISQNHAEDCAGSVLQDLFVDASAINNRIDEFLHSCLGDEESTKIYEEMVLDRGKFSQIRNYPTLLINYELVQAKSESELKSALCRRLVLEKEEGCSESITVKTIVTTVIAWAFWLLMLGLLVGVGVWAVIYFRNRLRKEMNKELKMQVSTAVEHYFQLSESTVSK